MPRFTPAFTFIRRTKKRKASRKIKTKFLVSVQIKVIDEDHNFIYFGGQLVVPLIARFRHLKLNGTMNFEKINFPARCSLFNYLKRFVESKKFFLSTFFAFLNKKPNSFETKPL